ASLDGIIQFAQPTRIVLWKELWTEVLDVAITKRPMQQCELLHQPGAQESNLDMLYGIHNQQAQPAIKSITPPDDLESRIRRKTFLTGDRINLFEGIPVGAETVIVDGTQAFYQYGFIRHNQSTLKQALRLLFK
ncbi:MAG: hypothetical protein Q8M58_04970, partial [Anaerolineales bacterium]|nr:hypothetical protein [Anaerolineales bacterium]